MTGVMARLGLQPGAVFLGVLLFIFLYALGAMSMVFALSLFSKVFDHAVMQLILRALGAFVLSFPAYVTARVAGSKGLRNAMVLGVVEGSLMVLLMTFTFSWEGTLKEDVMTRMPVVFMVVFVLCVAGGLLGDWKNRRA